MNRTMQITQTEYSAFQTAYDFFNVELFSGTLPPVLITLQRQSRAYGYLSPERFVGRSEETATHELALNPDHFGRTDEEILSTLVHEMAHVWQVTHGRPPRKSYHDKQWAAKVSHYVIEGGLFSVSFARLKGAGFTLRWQSRADDRERQKKAASKTKYTCPNCGQNAWAKPYAVLICGVCHIEDGSIYEMEAEA